MNIFLADSSSGIWLVGVTDQGILTQTPSGGQPTTLTLNDAGGNSWAVTISTGGILQQNPVTNGNYSTSIILESPGGFSFQLVVLTSGVLQQIPFSPPVSGSTNIMVGTIRRRQRSEFIV
jgi:hypothetical protein